MCVYVRVFVYACMYMHVCACAYVLSHVCVCVCECYVGGFDGREVCVHIYVNVFACVLKESEDICIILYYNSVIMCSQAMSTPTISPRKATTPSATTWMEPSINSGVQMKLAMGEFGLFLVPPQVVRLIILS